ncbi:MAG: short-chain-enoyl-CoA hydratase [Firmicutes bacterium]|nr:short-chain-enoyl-CoA hydratase [Bacillota bacterium]
MAWDNVLLEKDGVVGVVTVNRPKALNALNGDTLTEIGLAFDEVAKDDEIKVVILTGAGDKAFVAGADILSMQKMTPMESKAFSLLGQQVMSKIETFQKPVIAAINGFTLGGGCELAMCCDIRIATPKSMFGQPEVGLGIIPGFAGTQRLPRLIGKGRAKELIFSAANINAEEAYRIGLINKVVEEDQLMAEAKKMAGKIASKGQIAVRLAKEAINEGMEMDLDKAMIHEADLFGLCFSTEEQREGMTAFIEKRPAKFTGK